MHGHVYPPRDNLVRIKLGKRLKKQVRHFEIDCALRLDLSVRTSFFFACAFACRWINGLCDCIGRNFVDQAGRENLGVTVIVGDFRQL